MSEVLGIDFGTTHISAAVFEDGKPCRIRGADEICESVINKWIIENESKYNLYLDYSIHNLKRRLIFSQIKNQVSGEIVPAWELLFEVFHKLKLKSQERLTGSITEAVIVLPERFSTHKKKLIVEAANSAGIKDIKIISDGLASLIAYGAKTNTTGQVLACDFGGGVVSATLGKIKNGKVEQILANTEFFFGGLDFDRNIVERMVLQIKEQYGISLWDNKPAMIELYRIAENARNELCSVSDSSYKFNLAYWSVNDTKYREKYRGLSSEIDLKTVKQCIKGYMNLIRDMLQSMRDRERIDEVILTGGLSDMPLVGECVEKIFNYTHGHYLSQNYLNQNLQAIGAVLYARKIQPASSNNAKTAVATKQSKTSQNPYKILVTATMSAGKSTFINALIGRKVSKAENLACTDRILSFVNNAEGMGNYVKGDNAIGVNFKGLFQAARIIVKDSPGVNSSMNENHRKITIDEVSKGDYDLLLYIINATQIGVNDDSFYLDFVRENIKDKPIIFLINKIDCLNPDEEDMNAVLKRVETYVKNKKFSSPLLCPISAKAGFWTAQKSGEALDFDEQLEQRSWQRKFKEFGLTEYYRKNFRDVGELADKNDLSTLSGLRYVEEIMFNFYKGGI